MTTKPAFRKSTTFSSKKSPSIMETPVSPHPMTTKPAFRKSTTFSSKKSPSIMETPVSPHPMEILGEDITHFSHPQHPLMHVSSPYLFSCMGCKEYGAGKRFKCRNCDFVLHEFCALAPPSVTSHSLHTQHNLVFYNKSAGRLRSRCEVCGKATRGYAFRCSSCNFEMHPCCAELSRERAFPVHPHALHLQLGTTLTVNDSGSACNECKKKRLGRVYRCTVCDYCLHAVCAKDMVNGLHANGIKAPEKPSMFGAAARLASHVVLGFIGGLIEGIGEGVGEVFVESVMRSKPNSQTKNNKPANIDTIAIQQG